MRLKSIPWWQNLSSFGLIIILEVAKSVNKSPYNLSRNAFKTSWTNALFQPQADWGKERGNSHCTFEIFHFLSLISVKRATTTRLTLCMREHIEFVNSLSGLFHSVSYNQCCISPASSRRTLLTSSRVEAQVCLPSQWYELFLAKSRRARHELRT